MSLSPLQGFRLPSPAFLTDPTTTDRPSVLPSALFLESKRPPMNQEHTMHSPSLATSSTLSVPPLRTFGAMRDHVYRFANRPIDSDALIRPVRASELSWRHVQSEDGSSPVRGWTTSESDRSNFDTRSSIDESRVPPPTYPFESMQTNQERVKPIKSARRKEQCRNNQARYRERQKLKMARNEEKVAVMRELVGLLEAQRTALRSCKFPSPEYVRHVVLGFFRRFRRGLSGASFEDLVAESVPEWTGVGRAGRNIALLKQIAFVRCIVSEDADLPGGQRGPEALLEQIWRYSALYTNIRLELSAIRQLPASHAEAERVLAVGRLCVRVSEPALDVVFPGLRAPLRRRLLGRTLLYGMNLDLEFEKVDGSLLLQITRLDMQMDVIEALMNVLFDSVAVEEVLQHAQMEISGWICATSRASDREQ